MAQELYGFFDSAQDDARSYEADDLASAFHALCLSGVSGLGDCLRVSAEGGTMRTLALPGRAMLKGYFYELRDDGGAQTAFTHAAASGADRIDRIVVRLDLTLRQTHIAKKEGTAASTPQPPALARSATVYELSLAQVRVRAGATAIAPGDVTDERADESACGAALPEGVKLSTLWARMPKAEATDAAAGLMSAADKARVDAIDSELAALNGLITTAQGSANAAQQDADAAREDVGAAQASADAAAAAHQALTAALSSGAYLQVQSGSQTISCASGKTVTQSVTFPIAYLTPPSVTMSVITSLPRYINGSVKSVSATGCVLRVYNGHSKAQSLPVCWVAIGQRNAQQGTVTAADAQLAANAVGVTAPDAADEPEPSANEGAYLSAADKAKLDAFEPASAYALKSDIVSLYRHRGSVAAAQELPASGNVSGDVYNASDTGMNYVWTGDAWDALGQAAAVPAMSVAEIDAAVAD